MKSISVSLAVAVLAVAPAPAQPDVRSAASPWPPAWGRLANPVQSEMRASAEAGRVIVADQMLMAVVANAGAARTIEVGAGAFRTRDNALRDDAFAVFSGLLTQSWNSGTNANSQAATNVAWGSAGSGPFGLAAAADDRRGGR